MRKTALALLLSLACHPEPVSPPVRIGVRSIDARQGVTGAAFPPCTKHWKNSISGIWSFAVNWTPAGVPGPNDVVCIDAVGTYTVTAWSPPVVEAIVIGGRSAAPTLSYVGLPHQVWTLPTGIDVLTGVLAIDSSVTIEAGHIAVSGTLRVKAHASATWIFVDSLVNHGLVEFKAPTGYLAATGLVGVRNTGTIASDWGLMMALADSSEWRMEGGTFSGAGPVSVVSTTPGTPVPLFLWTGGSIPELNGGARLVIGEANLRLQNTALQGAVMTLAAPHVTGDVGPGVSLWVDGAISGPTVLRSLGGGALTNDGTMAIGTLDRLTVTGPGLVNNGELEIGDVTLTLDSLVNAGTMTVTRLGASMRNSASFIRNRGTIDALFGLELVGAAFHAEALSTQTGPLTLDGGTLSGVGSVGDITATSAAIEPGGDGGFGTLSAAGLTMNAASTLGIDLGGTSPAWYDVLAVSGAVHYDGTLALRERLPFVGGSCGQVIPIMTDASAGLPRGNFASVTGLVPAPTRAWRVYNPAGSFQLIGHDPTVAVSRAPAALTMSEGGAGGTYSLCLRSAPSALVTVATASAGGQLSLPAPIAFGWTNWALPRTVAVSAVNDVVFEPPPQLATIAHTVTSADPVYHRARTGAVAVTIVDNDGTTNHELAVLSAPPQASVGQSFTVSFRDFNLGPDVSVGATLTVPASTGFTYQASTGVLSCTYDSGTGTTCQVAGVASGASLDFTVTFIATQVGTYPTTYTLSTIQTDPNLANNARTQTITIY